jgi:hypothetical protein
MTLERGSILNIVGRIPFWSVQANHNIYNKLNLIKFLRRYEPHRTKKKSNKIKHKPILLGRIWNVIRYHVESYLSNYNEHNIFIGHYKTVLEQSSAIFKSLFI